MEGPRLFLTSSSCHATCFAPTWGLGSSSPAWMWQAPPHTGAELSGYSCCRVGWHVKPACKALSNPRLACEVRRGAVRRSCRKGLSKQPAWRRCDRCGNRMLGTRTTWQTGSTPA